MLNVPTNLSVYLCLICYLQLNYDFVGVLCSYTSLHIDKYCDLTNAWGWCLRLFGDL